MADDVSRKAGRAIEAEKRATDTEKKDDATPANGGGRGRALATRRGALRALNEERKNALRAPNEEKAKIVHIVQRLQEETNQSRARKPTHWVPISLAACVALPTVLAALFYLLIASDRYVSQVAFAVRNSESQSVDLLGGLTGLPNAQNVSDSYIVADYIVSRDMVQELERRLPLRTFFTGGDFFSRLSADASLDSLVEYWEGYVEVYFDSTKNTIVVEVQAFAAADADRIAREIVEIVRNLVNDLSAQARRDAVQFSASEVARAELRVRGARADMLAFRIEHNDVDPAQTAQATLGLAAQLEAERSKLSSELASLSGYLSDDAPSIQMLKSRIAALAGEISRIQGQVSVGPESAAGVKPAAASGDQPKSGALANVIGAYQELALSQEFAEKAYTATMASLENARSEASRTQSYLAIFGQPSLAEDPTYPRRWLNIWVVFIVACILWAIGMLGALTIKDHVR